MQSIEKVVLIGSGNVATQLAHLLIQKGLDILQVYSLHIDPAKQLAAFAESEAIDSIDGIRKDADLYIIAVKDDTINEINARLRLPGKLVVHTSGAVNLESISQVSDNTGVFYPLQTFGKTRNVDWQVTPIIIEASNPDTLQLLKQFAEGISGSVVEMDSTSRKRLHLAAVFANNFVNHLLGEAKEILGEGIPLSILEPLVRETIDKAFSQGIEASQTGPAIRHDVKTIEAHMALLEKLPDAQKIYRVITDSIIRKYRGNHS